MYPCLGAGHIKGGAWARVTFLHLCGNMECFDLLDDPVYLKLLFHLWNVTGVHATEGSFSSETLVRAAATGDVMPVYGKTGGEVFLNVSCLAPSQYKVEVTRLRSFSRKSQEGDETMTLVLKIPDPRRSHSPITNLATSFQQMKLTPSVPDVLSASQVVSALSVYLRQVAFAQPYPYEVLRQGARDIGVFSLEKFTGTKADSFSFACDDAGGLVYLHLRVCPALNVGTVIPVTGDVDDMLVIHLPFGGSHFATQRKVWDARREMDLTAIQAGFTVSQTIGETMGRVMAVIGALHWQAPVPDMYE